MFDAKKLKKSRTGRKSQTRFSVTADTLSQRQNGTNEKNLAFFGDLCYDKCRIYKS